MKILLGCNHTKALYNAIAANGHEVTSCDLKPAEHSGRHYKGNVFDIIPGQFDAALFFPPCTYLCRAQYGRVNKDMSRAVMRDNAIEFVDKLYNSGIPMISIENPIGYLNTMWRSPSQVVYPWFFGDPYRKDVCLWLKGLPPLISTEYNTIRKTVSNHVNSRMSQERKSEIKSSWNYYPGLCSAIASQWFPA